MKTTEVHVRKSEFFSPNVEPRYANKKYDLYYPRADQPEKQRNKKCLMTPDVLKGLLSLDLSQMAQTVEVDNSRVLRYIKSLDEKLNSPQYEFLKEFQPDVACSCDETKRPDAKCPCPPVKQPLNFGLFENCYAKTHIAPCQCYPESTTPRGQYSSCPAACRKDPRDVRDQLMRETEALQNKLSSPGFEFLYMAPAELEKSAGKTDDCGMPPIKPVDFRDKYDVIQKIQAMNGLLMSPEYGLSDCCRPTKSSAIVQTCKNGRSSSETRLCVPGCPPPPCRCGKGCPSMSGPFEQYPKISFHVPDCPADTFSMTVPRSPERGAKACPFSPACCPIGDVCPFPVNTVYDPSAPLLPPLQGPRRCPRVPTNPTSIADPSHPQCPLDQLRSAVPPQPPGCPLVKPTSCSIGQEANCPLLSCSLGPLKTLIFDGNDECPFCHSKCCPMITPDGPGCPINISGQFCALGNTDICALNGMASKQVPLSNQPGKDEESCPAGELLAQCSAKQGGPIGSQLQSSSCYCSPTTSTKPRRPEDCPLASMNVPPPAAPCPLAVPTSPKQCPMVKLGGANFDESCPASKIFQCPGLKKTALAKLLNQTSLIELHHNSLDRLKMDPSKEKDLDTTNVIPMKSKQTAGKVQNTKRSSKSKSSAQRKVPSKPQQSPSAVAGKNENVLRKAESVVYDSLPSHSSDRSKLRSSGSSLLDVSLEPLPHPPWSENENTQNSFRSRKRSSFQPNRSSKGFPSVKEDASHVKATAPNDSKGFQPEKQKPMNCPFPDPEKCPLEVPRCPFGPPEPSCPLAKTTRCGARALCKTGISAAQNECPVETQPCSLFPKGHCPMEDMNVCDCDFPVSPCMERLIPKDDASAPDQYCSRLNCCMGLPLPPTKPSEEFQTDTWYALAEALPGNKASKRYLQILNYPPEPEFFVSVNNERKHPAWNIIKQGEGYKKCKMVKELLAERGPSVDVTTQFQLDDLPDDEEIQIIEQNRINRQNAIKKILDSGSLQDWTDIQEFKQ